MPGAGFVYFMRRRQRAERQRIYRTRTNPFGMSESEVFRLFRFPPLEILSLANVLENQISGSSMRSCAVSPLVKVLATLHFVATGTFQRTSGVVAGLSQSTMSRCLHLVVPAILTLMPEHIIPPIEDDLREKTMVDFYALAGFPCTVGAIDCTHVALRPPSSTEHIYRNRKQWHSINVQVVADANCLIWHTRAKHPGSSHDSYIFRISGLPEDFEQNLFKESWLLGDSAYALAPYLLTPLRNPQSRSEQRYNTSHSRTRSVVERTFGLLKSRFRCLDKSGGTLLYSPNFVCEIIAACCILHNMAMRKGLEVVICDDLTPPPPQCNLDAGTANCEGVAIRQALIDRIFSR